MITFLSFNKKILLFLIVIISCFQFIQAQKIESNFWNHIRYGGGFGLNFGDRFFSATLAPNAVYEFDKNFAFGLGLNATFNNQKKAYKSTILGTSLIGLYNVIDVLQISAEFEELNINRKYDINLNIPDDNYWLPALFIGAGYRSGNIIFGIRYDLLYNEDKSIYSDPWAPFVRFYF